MRWHHFIAGMLGLAAATTVATADNPSVTILYHVRPPYAEPGAPVGVKGLLVAPVIRAMNSAEISVHWMEMPPARQTEEIKRAQEPVCGLGWFKRPEREEFAVFTAPIYQDRPSVAVARKDDARFTTPAALQFLFADHTTKLIVKTGYSYGAVIDAWIERQRPDRAESAGSNEEILNMIANDRGDYAVMAPEEAEYLLKRDQPLGVALRVVELSDAPEGEQRYLMCSKSTPLDTLVKLNTALSDPANW